MAAAELGLRLDDPGRPLTLTGGLTFGGGPGNNYTSHGIARCVETLRAVPGSVGLVSGLGWYATKHALGVYASRPPRAGGFSWRDVQAEVDALPRCRRGPGCHGAGEGRDVHRHLRPRGLAVLGIVVCRTPDERRAWGNVTDPDALAQLCAEEGIGRTGTLAPGGALSLAGA